MLVALAGGVGVMEGVRLGVTETSGVAVGVEEGVLVGKVDVGKGPRSACIVPASAVFVAAALGPPSDRARKGLPNTSIYRIKIKPVPNRIGSAVCWRTGVCSTDWLLTLAIPFRRLLQRDHGKGCNVGY